MSGKFKDPRVVIHVRIPRSHQRKIQKIAEKRGHPHTNSSVTAELIAIALSGAA